MRRVEFEIEVEKAFGETEQAHSAVIDCRVDLIRSIRHLFEASQRPCESGHFYLSLNWHHFCLNFSSKVLKTKRATRPARQKTMIKPESQTP